MIHRQTDARTEVRSEMRGGKGNVTIQHLWSESEDFHGPVRLCAKLILEPGCGIGYHTHEQEEEFFYIISGIASANDNGQEVTLSPGETMLTGNGAGHAIENKGNSTLEVLATIIKY